MLKLIRRAGTRHCGSCSGITKHSGIMLGRQSCPHISVDSLTTRFRDRLNGQKCFDVEGTSRRRKNSTAAISLRIMKEEQRAYMWQWQTWTVTTYAITHVLSARTCLEYPHASLADTHKYSSRVRHTCSKHCKTDQGGRVTGSALL